MKIPALIISLLVFTEACAAADSSSSRRRNRRLGGRDDRPAQDNEDKIKAKKERRLDTLSGVDEDCPGREHRMRLEFTTDEYPEESTWEITNEDGELWYKGFDYDDAMFTHTHGRKICEGCYKFQVKDDAGDGMCCSYGKGGYKMYIDGKEEFRGGEFKSSKTHEFCVSKPQTNNCNIRLEVDVRPDDFPDEVSWKLKEKGGAVVESGTTGRKVALLCSGKTYDFVIEDDFGDGICCSRGKGSYTLNLNGRQIRNGGEFGRKETTRFTA